MQEGTHRQCGECSECCVVMEVEGVANREVLRKPSHTPCMHQKKGGGCAVYAARPGPCASWSCMWRKGTIGQEGDRPDKTGIIVHELPIAHRDGTEQLVIMTPSRKGAQSTRHAREIRRDLVRSGRSVLVDTSTTPSEVKRRLIVSKKRSLPGRMVLESQLAKIPIHQVTLDGSK